MNQATTPSTGHNAAGPGAELSAATLGILVELANGCAEDRANWGAPGSNDRHATHYYLDLIRRRMANLAGSPGDRVIERSALLQIARHALSAIEALDSSPPDHRG